MSGPARIHPTAQVDPRAVVGEGSTVGAFAVLGAEVVLGAGSIVHAHAVIEGPTVLGEGNRVFPFACLGMEPQDLKHRGERTTLRIGHRNTFREGVTVHRGTTGGGGETVVGSDNLLMAGTHVAHDCHVGDRIVFANAATLAGHVTVEDDATVGAFTGVHQFCRIGRHAYVGGYSVITQDAPPFIITVGNRDTATHGINVIGLKRKQFSADSIQALRGAYKLLFRAHLGRDEAIARVRSEHADHPEVLVL
ncbi:MAG TPA: acyl-ACP--UDP-N-acetylglucosamine O-acyltransferase, partial [Candidatus Polarisedimenticolia bacterium]|nr:acyl-ACP--UDP-N-acetylglucosamine O-acyltransferase [Candidatus Polarisedimenticolia bacterium]